MKPVNLDVQPCNPISSNCVVWQGPDVPCISLCTGDTISDVFEALAKELCEILDLLNVDNYDLSCFNITNCKPKNFIELINFITKQVCLAQGTPVPEKSTKCPDCMITVPTCLNAPQPVMNLVEYTLFLGQKICTIIEDIADIWVEINSLKNRVSWIEQNCCDKTIPVIEVDVNCAVPESGTFVLANAFESFVNDFFCTFYNGTTGTISELETAINSQCIANTDPTKVDPDVPYGNIPEWVNTPGTVADAINNIWLVLCDLYAWNPEPPDITLNCAVPVATTGSTSDLFESFINDFFCAFYAIIGTTASLTQEIQPDCLISTYQSKTNPTITLAQLTNWVEPPTTLAESINNIWVALCDLYNIPVVSVQGANTTTINTVVTSTGSTPQGPIIYTVTSDINDTGWHCLNGFNHYATNTPKPKVRRIGNVLHFKGLVCIPLDSNTSPNTVVTWTYNNSTNTYMGTLTGPASGCLPFTGQNGVTTGNTPNFIRFNNGNSVIPTAVLPSGYVIDGGYSGGLRIAWRSMGMYQGTTLNSTTALTSIANIIIDNSGSLIWQSLVDIEQAPATTSSLAYSSSHLNYIVSHVTGGNFGTQFTGTLNVYGSFNAGNQTAQPNFSNQIFYPISINANNLMQMGGFMMILDGLTAFISPCVTPTAPSIPAPVLDTNACNGVGSCGSGV